MSSSSVLPPFVSVALPAELAPARFDRFEFVRQLFPPVVEFLTHPDAAGYSDKQIRSFLRGHQDTLVSTFYFYF